MSQIEKSQELKVHLDQWRDCRLCPLGERACKHVMFSTYNYILPRQKRMQSDTVDVMFIGEGPGEAEDVIGKPFIGPTGRFLRRECWPLANPSGLVIMMANLVACRPQDKIGGPNRAPHQEEIEACRPRLVKLIEIFDPLVIATLGRVPEDYLRATLRKTEMCKDSPWAGPTFNLPHPSAISRRGGTSSPDFEVYVASLTGVFIAARRQKGIWRQ